MVKVKVYSTPTCPWCKKTKEFLKENQIKFMAVDVSTNEKAQQGMIKKSGQTGVPVLDIDGQIIVGYAPKEILKLVQKGKKK